VSRWLIVTQYYPPEIGAPQIRLRTLACKLRDHGIDVEVLTAMPNYPAGKIFEGYTGKFRMSEFIDGIRIRRTWVYAGTGRSALVRLVNYLSFTFSALVDALLGQRPDVLFLESQPLSLGVVGLLMKYLRGVPYVYNVPDLQVQVARQLGFMRNRLFLRLALGLENLFLRQSWKVSTVTHNFVNHFESRGLPREQITFLPNGADSEFLSPKPPSVELLKRWGLNGQKVFAYVGTHAYYHGLGVLIEAARQLRERHDICFLMIGDGPERPRLQQLCRDLNLENVVFGESGYEEMDQLYSIVYSSIATLRNMDVAKGMRLSKVFPSLSCGVPVVYSGVGEAAELIDLNGCGVVVAPENAHQLADAILDLASDPRKRNSMGQAGRDLVTREYDWARIVERWLREIGIMPLRDHS
jgi:putative colanic acid biosynthesis glycosyltransferase WcaI